MKTATPKLLLAALASAAVAGTAVAAPSVSYSGNDTVLNDGTLIYAYNLGMGPTLDNSADGSQTTRTHGGITYDDVKHNGNHNSSTLAHGIDISGLSDAAQDFATSGASLDVYWTSAGGDHMSSGQLSGSVASTTDDLFYSSSWVNGTSTSSSMIVGGLDAGKTYRVQLLAGDNRSWSNWNFDVIVDSVDTGSNFQWGVQPGIQKNVAIIDGLTGATSYEIELGGGFGGFGGVVVHEVVPEPSSLALIGLGGLAMLRRRRG